MITYKIVLSSGKEVELTNAEFAELCRSMRETQGGESSPAFPAIPRLPYYPPYPQPYTPWWEIPRVTSDRTSDMALSTIISAQGIRQ